MIYSELLTKQRQLRKMTDTMCPLWSFSTARKFFCDGFNVSINTNKLSYGGARSACSEQNIGLLRIKEHNLLKKSQCYKVRIHSHQTNKWQYGNAMAGYRPPPPSLHIGLYSLATGRWNKQNKSHGFVCESTMVLDMFNPVCRTGIIN